VPAFNIVPVGVATDIPNAGANAYTNKGFIGQLQSGAFGSFGVGDTWSATGQIVTPSFTTYGARQQYAGYTVNSGLLKNNISGNIDAIMDFGNSTQIGLGTYGFKFRSFTNPNDPSTVKNIWQSSNKFSNIVLGRQDFGVVNSEPFYLSLFDGVASNTSTTVVNFVNRAGIYATTDGKDELGASILKYASIIGEVETPLSDFNQSRYALLGITSGNANGKIWAGYFVGDVAYTGNLTFVSDKKFKTNINDEESIITKIMLLKPKNYLFDTEKNKNMGFSKKLQHGLISQEVETIFPELVQETTGPSTSKDIKLDGSPESYKGLNYIGFIPMLIKAIQEQQTQIQDLKTQLNATAKNTFVINDKNSLPAEIENKAFTLSQNTPNPFSEKTTISYSIPSNVNKAMLAIFDLNGKMLLQYNLQQGKNQLTINGNSLSAGMYLYSLIADGQEVLSKRMVLTK
jgi:hypothetical protein